MSIAGIRRKATKPPDRIGRELVNVVFKTIAPEEFSLEKRNWIEQARAEFIPADKGECFVCGKFQVVTHAHHLVPLALQFDRHFEKPDHSHVWLCPNHHAVLHLLIGNNDFSSRSLETLMVYVRDCWQAERKTLVHLVTRSALGYGTFSLEELFAAAEARANE